MPPVEKSLRAALHLCISTAWRLPPAFYSEVADGVGFEPTRERNPLLVFKTSALNHSAILPIQRNQPLAVGLGKNATATFGPTDPTWTQRHSRPFKKLASMISAARSSVLGNRWP
jgi:hypothetical protein